jgi:nucleoporin POM152
VQISVHDAPAITPLETSEDYCVGDRINFGLSGVAPFNILYTFDGVARKAAVASGNTFRRLAEKPGVFVVTGLQDSASNCRAATQITKRVHGMPSVRVSKGKDAYIDIHEGSEAEILFEFGGVPPFEFTYTRSSNTEKGGKKGVVLDMKTASSEGYSMKIAASEGGTYEVVAIKDAHCAYTKPGVRVPDKKERNKRLTY